MALILKYRNCPQQGNLQEADHLPLVYNGRKRERLYTVGWTKHLSQDFSRTAHSRGAAISPQFGSCQ